MTDKHLNKAEAQALAESVAEVMWARDRATNALGMKIEAVRPGYARGGRSRRLRPILLPGPLRL